MNGNLIADWKALDECFDMKGANGIRNCIDCANCVKKGYLTDPALRIPDPNGVLREHTCSTFSEFIPNTNRAVYETCDELRNMQQNIILDSR